MPACVTAAAFVLFLRSSLLRSITVSRTAAAAIRNSWPLTRSLSLLDGSAANLEPLRWSALLLPPAPLTFFHPHVDYCLNRFEFPAFTMDVQLLLSYILAPYHYALCRHAHQQLSAEMHIPCIRTSGAIQMEMLQ